MKKLFISCPMKDRTEEAIKDSMSRMHRIAELIFGEELEVIDSYITDTAPTDNNRAMWYLGKSIQMMADADYFIGVAEFGHNGCEVERVTAIQYGLPVELVSTRHLMPDIERPVGSAATLGFAGFGGFAR
mgnify:CR=1 FL=1